MDSIGNHSTEKTNFCEVEPVCCTRRPSEVKTLRFHPVFVALSTFIVRKNASIHPERR